MGKAVDIAHAQVYYIIGKIKTSILMSDTHTIRVSVRPRSPITPWGALRANARIGVNGETQEISAHIWSPLLQQYGSEQFYAEINPLLPDELFIARKIKGRCYGIEVETIPIKLLTVVDLQTAFVGNDGSITLKRNPRAKILHSPHIFSSVFVPNALKGQKVIVLICIGKHAGALHVYNTKGKIIETRE